MSVERSELNVERFAPRGAVFLSYASQDAEAAKRICDALRAAGVEVWFDQSELVGGDAWDQKIRKQIKECALLIPIISANTQSRTEGYFRLEWRLADQRTHLMAKGRAFLLPVVIDDTRDADAHVPDSFTEVQWTRLPGGETPPAFAARVKRLLGGTVAGVADPGLPGSASLATSRQAPPRKKFRSWLVAAIVLAAVSAAVWQQQRNHEPAAPAVAGQPAETTKAPPLTAARKLMAEAQTLIDDPNFSRENYRLADELCQRASALDAADAEIWATAALVSTDLISLDYDTSPQRRELARTQADRALRLDPRSIRAGLATAKNQRLVGDLPEAIQRLRELLKQAPTDRLVLRELARTERENGNDAGVNEALARLQTLPGGDAVALFIEAKDLRNLGRARDAEALVDQMLAGSPARSAYYEKLLLLARSWSDLPAARQFLKSIPIGYLREDAFGSMAAQIWIWSGDGDRALEVLDKVSHDYLEEFGANEPKGYLAGWAHQIAGRSTAAQAEWQNSLALVETRLGTNKHGLDLLFMKATLQALLGQKDAAQSTWKLRVELGGTTKPAAILDEVGFRVLLGEPDEAASILQRRWSDLGVGARSWYFSNLRYAPEFAPIRGDPRIQRLIAEQVAALEVLRHPQTAGKTALREADEKSVAVLPFANLSGDKDQEYFSDGLTEEILNALARERDLRVPGRSSSFSFKGKNATAAEIAKALNVSRLVEGSVRKSGNKVRISVSLTRASDGFSEELGTFTEELTDIFELQDKVARVVVAKLTQRAGTKPVASLTNNPEAYDAYLRGRALQTRAAHLQIEAAAHYERAVALDPAFALAWARLAEARFRDYSGLFDRSPTLVTTSREAIDRALTAQADLPEGLIMRANWAREVAFDFTGAQRDLDRAEALQPPTAELRQAQAYLARDQGNWPEALRRVREALELDPQNGDYTNTFALNIYEPRGDWREADRLFARAMEIQGTSSVIPFRNRLVLRSAWRGPEAALRLIERAPKEQAKLDLVRADVLASLGRTDEARVAVGQIEQQAPAGVRLSLELLASGSTAAGSLPMLEACGRQDLARQVAEELRTKALRQMERGNRAPWVRRSLIQAETTLGHHAVALAALEEWRHEYERFPSVFRRIHEFHRLAIPLYAALGQADLVLAQLRECSANGYRVDYTFAGALYFGPVRDDPRIQEWVQQHEEWTKALPDPIDL